MLYIIRNSRDYGPYDESQVLAYVNGGSVVMQDTVRIADTGEMTTVREVLKRNGISRASGACFSTISSRLHR